MSLSLLLSARTQAASLLPPQYPDDENTVSSLPLCCTFNRKKPLLKKNVRVSKYIVRQYISQKYLTKFCFYSYFLLRLIVIGEFVPKSTNLTVIRVYIRF